MASKITLTLNVNGKDQEIRAFPDTPLLWVLREQLHLTGTKFGCGMAMCGACTVHVDGKPEFSCLRQIQHMKGKRITTIEGLSSDSSHPLQKAWIAEQVPQCGYCQSGQIMRAAALLKEKRKPTRKQIVEHMKFNLCRCASYRKIVAAVERAVKEG